MWSVVDPRLVVLLAAIGSLLATACNDERRTRSIAGRDLYLRYCTSCHGEDGKGQGPVAASLRTPPADLTQIAKRAGGRFDEATVLGAIDGRRAVAAHGPREMPVWGAVFGDELKGQAYPEYVNLLQSRALMDYLHTLQEK
jgi:mono/diheme cytochrome c family protein